MSRLILVPYKMGSETCKAIKEAVIALGYRCLRVKPDSRKFTPKRGDKIVYYGGGQPSRFGTGLNENRELAQNKLKAFQALKDADLSTVEWTTDKTEALKWDVIVGRRILSGHSGQGIFIHDKNDGGGEFLQDAPLYTKYMKKAYECRVHVFNGEVIDAQIKRKVRDAVEIDTAIRNIHTGWVYCRDNFTVDTRAADLSIGACAALGLDFGAVDLIYNKYYDKFYVLEINTAPGLTGTTLNNYVSKFIEGL